MRFRAHESNKDGHSGGRSVVIGKKNDPCTWTFMKRIPVELGTIKEERVLQVAGLGVASWWVEGRKTLCSPFQVGQT